MAATKCPNCGANMEITATGPQHDRVLHCGYCNHQVDLVDEVTTQRDQMLGQDTKQPTQNTAWIGKIFLVLAGFAVICGIGAFLVLVLASA